MKDNFIHVGHQNMCCMYSIARYFEHDFFMRFAWVVVNEHVFIVSKYIT